jgi:hypothetical protein
MTDLLNDMASGPAAIEELIKNVGDQYLVPDPNEIAKFSLAECAQLADELNEKGLVDTIEGFSHMPVLDKRKALIKAISDLTGLQMDDYDPIVEFASQVEKVSTRAEIENMYWKLEEGRNFGKFQSGGIIAVGQQLFEKQKTEFAGFHNYPEYVKTVLGIRYNKAIRLMGIYRKLRYLGVPWSAFENIGWTKILAIVDVVTTDNVKQWVDTAKATNLLTLRAKVQAEKLKGQGGGQHPKATSAWTVKLTPKQKEVIEAGLAKAKQETGSSVAAVALEAILQDYLGAGMQFSSWEQALAYGSKHSKDEVTFINEVVQHLREIRPEFEISVEITPKE